MAAKVKRELRVEKTFHGRDLVGRRYRPPFDYYYKDRGDRRGALKSGGDEAIAWRVVAADFVTIESGTGLVHLAPAFGEVDFDVLLAEQARFKEGQGPDMICAVAPDGKFTSEAPPYAGRWVKDADKDITRELRQRGLLYHQEQYVHDYPFCWRAEEDPLIQYPRKSWFIRTTAVKEQMLANNREIHWVPGHIRDGRFGNFLESNVDWALSRERYWGTPLPIWVCEATGKREAVASYQELLKKPGVQGTEVWEAAKKKKPDLSDHLKVHKPYIDAVTYESPFVRGARMRRVSEVIDCWFDSGAMPFAQWGYPHQGRGRFVKQFPADFISEAIDQTRGWFYSQLAISTLLFSGADGAQADPERSAQEWPHPFKNCVVLGLILGEDGNKMSKSKRNYREPDEIFDRYGADAMRWYFFANQPPWTPIRFNERAIKESIPEFLLRLWNVFSFFRIYSQIDQFVPAEGLSGDVGDLSHESLRRGKMYQPLDQRGELDRWVLSELYRTVAAVRAKMDDYDCYAACQEITKFVDALSNWYVRRSRDRFWSGDKNQEKANAYWTLFECLAATSKLVAPFVPFLAESMWQELVAKPFGERATESVHLCDYPVPPAGGIDEELSAEMGVVREIASLGRSARMGAKLKVRQPLGKVEVILVDPSRESWLADHVDLIRDELNVKVVEFTRQGDDYISYEVLPNFKRLGPKLGKNMPAVKQALAAADASAMMGKSWVASTRTVWRSGSRARRVP
jgi:isoleucyl-tRNA synthetase